jgi:hypothetical protein
MIGSVRRGEGMGSTMSGFMGFAILIVGFRFCLKGKEWQNDSDEVARG